MIDLESGDIGDYSKYDPDLVLYNKWLLIDAGLAIGGKLTSDDRLFAVTLIRLTWEGCEFLDLAREESTWKTALESGIETAGSISVQVLINLLTHIVNTKLGLV